MLIPHRPGITNAGVRRAVPNTGLGIDQNSHGTSLAADHDDAVASSAQITKSLERVDAFMAEAGSYLSEIESNIWMNDSLTQNFAAARSALKQMLR